jgi:NAD+ synthase (glutamine-hydrolysing)
MKCSILQLNPVVGDLNGNAEKIIHNVKKAQKENPDIIITSELALLGYPPRDFLLMEGFINKSQKVLKNIAHELEDYSPLLVGTAKVNHKKTGRPLYNTAALLYEGKIQKWFGKTLLPTYDVFDEDRYFEPVKGPQILSLQDKKIGISICEDIWNDRDFWKNRRYRKDPIEELVSAGVDMIINMSASPFTAGKQTIRETMLSSVSKKYQIPIIYVNQVGGNDDLVFDGRSCVFNNQGFLISRAPAFLEAVVTIDLDHPDKNSKQPDDFAPESEIWRALILGTRDYVHKTGFKTVLIGLSGGIDSALVAAVAVEAVGKQNVTGVLMPSPYSSPGSIEDARKLADNLGIKSINLPIAGIMESYDFVLKNEFAKFQPDITEENIQARIRGTLLMALSNKFGSLLLTTGNKSEVSVGYCTLYGDMCGALGVIADVPKIMVYRIARWINRQNNRMIIPEAILKKAPSAELRPNQTDQDSLPPYDLLDEILHHHIELHQSPEQIISLGYPEKTVHHILHMVKIAEFKRKQAAPGIKVTDQAFGTGWRMPIATKEWYLE